MHKLAVVVFAMTALGAAVSSAQTAAPASTTTVKYIQPGLVDVAGLRVNEVLGAGIKRISATPGKGWRSITVQSPWGDSYFGWPKNLKQVPFTIASNSAGGATVSAPGLNDANKADYKAAIEAIIPFAIQKTLDNKNFAEGSR